MGPTFMDYYAIVGLPVIGEKVIAILEERAEHVEYSLRKGKLLAYYEFLRANVSEKEITNREQCTFLLF